MTERNADPKTEAPQPPSSFRFRQFFFRGLATLLPTVLTLWLLFIAWNFLNQNIAQPINSGVRTAVVLVTPWPYVLEEDVLAHQQRLQSDTSMPGYPRWRGLRDQPDVQKAYVRFDARRAELNRWWQKNGFYMDLIGLVIAVILVYSVGALVGSFIGRSLYHRGERFIVNLPLVRKVYPAVKQVTDFFVGERPGDKLDFNRVVAVEYPRKGLLSLGLVTGETMRAMQNHFGEECLTVFIPSSPTPFTGYVITVPKRETIDIPIPIDEALRFTVSGGVSIPDSQQIYEKLRQQQKPKQPRITDDADVAKTEDHQSSDHASDNPSATTSSK